jgi:hypothetical protein
MKKIATKFIRWNKQINGYEMLCGKCREWWPADPEFYHKSKRGRDVDGVKLYNWCRACCVQYDKETREKKKQALPV